MGVETGPSGVVAVAGPPPSFEAAPALASIVNEGPVRGSLEGFRPMNTTDITTIDKGGVIAPIGEIVFNPPAALPVQDGEGLGAPVWNIPEATDIDKPAVIQPINQDIEPLSKASVVEEAKHWLGIPNTTHDVIPSSSVIPAEAGIHFNNDLWIPDPAPKGSEARLWRQVGDDKVVQPEVRKITSSAASPSTVRQIEPIYVPATQEQLVDEIVEEEKINEFVTDVIKTEDRTDEFTTEEEATELKLKYVEDEEVSSKRKYQIGQAIEKADAEVKEKGNEEIEGKVLKKYFAPEDQSNRSGIAKPGVPDGSLQQTYEVLAARNYGSAREARETADTTVAQLKPVTKAKEGKKVKERDIARIRRDPFLKRHPVEEVVARIVKKRILAEKTGQKPIVIHEVQAESLEGTIEDLDLAEIFPKAA